jgi:hypothetical protein
MSSLRSFSDFVGSFWAGFFVFLDREAPTVKNCPHDVHVRLSSLEPYANAPWAEPVFSDNIAVTHVIKSKVWTVVVPPSFDNTATLFLSLFLSFRLCLTRPPSQNCCRSIIHQNSFGWPTF